MIKNYNPFSPKDNIKTEHGLINYSHEMGTVYVTHRNKNHFFIKFNGFGISESELMTCFENNVYWVLIIYHKSNDTDIVYRIKLDSLKYCDSYNHNGDNQRIIRIKELENKQDGKWI